MRMQKPKGNSLQSKMFETDKEILMKSVIHDEDFKFYENFNYFKRQFENFNDFKQILEENFFDYELLKAALARKHENIINYLINDCCCRVSNPNEIKLEETPLYLSLMNLENNSMFKTILNKGASIYDKNFEGRTLLHAAFKKGHYETVTILLNYISSSNLSFNPDNQDDVLHFHIACIRKHLSSVILYVSLGFNVNSHISVDLVDYPGLTPLLFLLASEVDYSAEFELIQVLIMSEGVDVNSSIPLNSEMTLKNKKIAGFTPLHFAAQESSLELVELLLKNGADCNRLDNNGKTPLHLVCENDKNNKSMAIIEIFSNCYSRSLVAVDKFGGTPIHSEFINTFAAPHETNILDLLISKQPLSDNLTDRNGLSLFHIVCTRNEPDLVNHFLNSGVKIDSCVSAGRFQGYTALHFAVYFHQKAIVELLLKRNAPANMKTHDLNTPLHLACAVTTVTLSDERQRGISNDEPKGLIANLDTQLDIIKLLLSYGADVKAKNASDFTPLFHACSAKTDVLNYLFNYISSKEVHSRFIAIFKILLSNKADINCTNENQLSIFHIICKNFTTISDELMECFITAGADINAVDKDGLTPLHYTADRGKEELLEIFLKYKANVNVKCKRLCRTPLQYAVSSFSSCKDSESITNCINTLIDNGSDLSVRTETGRTLLHDAVSFSIYFLVKKLLYYGADVNAEDSLGKSIVCCVNTEKAYDVSCVIFVHVQKLLALGLHVNEKVQKFCVYIYEYCKNHLWNTNFPIIMDNAFGGCTNELNKLKIIKIDDDTSLYNFLLNDPHDLSKYAKNRTVIDIFERGNIDEEFPLYGYLLKLQYKKSLLL